MALSTDLERLSYGGPAGCVATGIHREVITVTAARTLLPEESGSLVVLGVAAGAVVTLPTPKEGMQFDFSCSVSRTSNSYKIITATPASQFLLGAYMAGDNAIATSGDIFTGDGTTHVAMTFDGDTKGGLIGGHLRFTALSATQWFVEGLMIGTGTMVTAFATS
jgi:hypothetical protein